MASNVSDDKKLDKLNEASSTDDSSKNNSANKKIKACGLKALVKVPKNKKSSWDPLSSVDWDAAGPPSHLAATRIRRDISFLFKEPLPGIFAIPDERNLCLVHCLVHGPFETPYEGGFFHFAVRFGPSYPIHPPRVRLMTTDAGKVRFNPNLYANGKVCLSILGTWSGPVWSPALNLGSLLLSIQSLLNEKPYFNEPGIKAEHYRGESDNYNTLITHETLRVAVCGQLEDILDDTGGRKMILPSELANVIKETFLDLYDDHVDVCNKYKHLDKQQIIDFFFSTNISRHAYNFEGLLDRLKALKDRLVALNASEKKENVELDSSLSSISDDEDTTNAKEYAVMGEEKEYLAGGAPLPCAGATGTCEEQEKYTIDDDLELLMDDDDMQHLEEQLEHLMHSNNQDDDDDGEEGNNG